MYGTQCHFHLELTSEKRLQINRERLVPHPLIRFQGVTGRPKN